MAKKKVATMIKLQVPAGRATPAPPVGPALGPHGVSTPQFVQQFNDVTKDVEPGLLIPVVITVYADRSFSFITKTPPAAVLIKRAVGLEKGSPESNKLKVGKITRDQLRAIAELKMVDLNANDIEAAIKIIAGTARSLGVEIAAPGESGGVIEGAVEAAAEAAAAAAAGSPDSVAAAGAE